MGGLLSHVMWIVLSYSGTASKPAIYAMLPMMWSLMVWSVLSLILFEMSTIFFTAGMAMAWTYPYSTLPTRTKLTWDVTDMMEIASLAVGLSAFMNSFELFLDYYKEGYPSYVA